MTSMRAEHKFGLVPTSVQSCVPYKYLRNDEIICSIQWSIQPFDLGQPRGCCCSFYSPFSFGFALWYVHGAVCPCLGWVYHLKAPHLRMMTQWQEKPNLHKPTVLLHSCKEAFIKEKKKHTNTSSPSDIAKTIKKVDKKKKKIHKPNIQK